MSSAAQTQNFTLEQASIAHIHARMKDGKLPGRLNGEVWANSPIFRIRASVGRTCPAISFRTSCSSTTAASTTGRTWRLGPARAHARNSPRFPFGYNPARILLGDVDGDGLSDVVYVDNGQVTLWINQCGNAWSDPIVIRGTPTVTDMDSVRLVDLLGNGISGILWSADASLPGRARMFFLDFTGATKPYLLNEMEYSFRGAALSASWAGRG
jgi:hypothetical protein